MVPLNIESEMQLACGYSKRGSTGQPRMKKEGKWDAKKA